MALEAFEIVEKPQDAKTVVEAADADKASRQLLPQFPPCTPPPGLVRLPVHERSYVPDVALSAVAEDMSSPSAQVVLDTDDSSSQDSPEQKRPCRERSESNPESEDTPISEQTPDFIQVPFSRSLIEALDMVRLKGASDLQIHTAARPDVSRLPPGQDASAVEAVGKRAKKNKHRKGKTSDAPSEDTSSAQGKSKCEEEPLLFKLPTPVALEGVKSMKKDILKVDAMSFCYSSRNNDTLKDISFKLSQSSRVLIVGKKDSGKTTLTKLLMGQELPSRGAIMFASGLRAACLSADTMQQLESNSTCTPEQYIRQSFGNSSDAQARDLSSQSIQSFLANFGFETGHVQKQIHQLSSRMKLRLFVAVALWRSPNILILDEVARFLNASDVKDLMPALESYKGGILATCHARDQHLMESSMSQVWILRGSSLQVQGEGVLDSVPQESHAKIVARNMMKQLEARVKDPNITPEEKMRLLNEAKELLQRI